MYEEYWEKEEPIKEIHCSISDCENDLHTFRRKYKKDGTYRSDVCINCGVDIIDWERLEVLDINDVDFTFSSLKTEWLRNYYWFRKVEENVVRNTKKRHLDDLRVSATKRLDSSLTRPYDVLWNDGSQTPFHGYIIYYAQHATATCCRKCVQEWYNIERDRRLTNFEVNYFKELMMLYIQNKFPELE